MIAEYIAKIENTDGIYTVTFPDFKITGRGYADLELTRQMAGYMLAEIILDHEAKGRPLPKPSFTHPGGAAQPGGASRSIEFAESIEAEEPIEATESAFSETVRVDVDEYALDSRKDEAARYYDYV